VVHNRLEHKEKDNHNKEEHKEHKDRISMS
jgi:hypothetical protein